MNDDSISRQAAIDAMTNTLWHYPNECYKNLNEYEFAKGLAELGLKSVPSAQPERKHGYWVESQEHVYMGSGVKEWTNWYCSECDAPNGNPSDFCPSCGADMRGEQDDESRSKEDNI